MLDPKDPETYNAELDFYFNQYDYYCGLKAVDLGGLIYAFDSDGSRHRRRVNSDTVRLASTQAAKPHTDPWANHEAIRAFGRGREVWAVVKRLPGPVFERLQRWYTLRQREQGQNWGPAIPTRTEIVSDHMVVRRLQVEHE